MHKQQSRNYLIQLGRSQAMEDAENRNADRDAKRIKQLLAVVQYAEKDAFARGYNQALNDGASATVAILSLRKVSSVFDAKAFWANLCDRIRGKKEGKNVSNDSEKGA